MSDTTAKWSIPFMEGADIGNTINETDQAKAELLDDLVTPFDQGALASRPVSSPGTPGIAGRNYRATDGANAGRVFRDYGTGWEEMTVQRSPEPTLKTIRGSVNADGTITGGEGFTITKGASGAYTINFSVSFSAVPSVKPGMKSAVPGFIAILTPSVSVCDIRTWNSSAALEDRAFTFDAIGPA